MSDHTSPHFRRAAIIGLGMIGGSFAAGLKQRRLVDEVVGCGRSQANLQAGLACGVVDEVTTNPAEAVCQADLVFIATPILAFPKVLEAIAPALEEDVLITDGASVKARIVEEARKALKPEFLSRFVPAHPIAGSEKSGVTAANPDLYVDHRVILTPVDETSGEALLKARNLWHALGAEVLEMDLSHHDEVLAATSHLPHLLAFSLVDSLAQQGNNREIFQYAAGGFRDFTRIASSDPVMWHDIFQANRPAVLQVLDTYLKDLADFRRFIAEGNSEAMLGVLTRAKSARDHFTAMNQSTSYSKAGTSMSQTHRDVRFIAQPGGSVSGEIRVPGDKSISHRSIMLGALAEGITDISGFLEGEDALATLQAFRDMGVVIEGPHAGKVRVHGVGMQGLKPPATDLYMGNSGTSMRLLAGILAGQRFTARLTGDASLSRRPMERVAKPLRQMGAVIETAEGGRPPLVIRPAARLKAIHYDLPMASAQVKSCVLLAGLYADGETVVTEPAPTRDHTERMLRGFGYEVNSSGNRISLKGGGRLTAAPIEVPADISSAAFFMVAASIAPRSDITLTHVGINPTRIGVINILKQMGADIELSNKREVGGEPVADIRVRYAPLQGIRIPEDQVPLAIDEFPAIFIAAACANGETVLTGAEELRVKESDRIQSMADGLVSLGIDAHPTEDGIVIRGGEMGSAVIEAHGDHRIAMAFAVASLRARGLIEIHDCANVATSFPGFVELANRCGLNLEQVNGVDS